MNNKLAIPDKVNNILGIFAETDRDKLAQRINAEQHTLSFDSIIRMANSRDKDGKPQIPTLGTLISKNGFNELKRTVGTINVILKRFIKNNFQNSDEQIQDIIYDFTSDTLGSHSVLTIQDIIYFTKYIRENAGRKDEVRDFNVYGNILTPIKLAELFSYYLEDRAVAHERYLTLEKSNLNSSREMEEKTRFVVRLAEKKYAKLTQDGSCIGVEEVERKYASPLGFATAYKLSEWAIGEGLLGTIMRHGEEKQSLVDYIRQKLPHFFIEKELPEQTSTAEKLDEKRMAAIINFIDKCEELTAAQKKELDNDVKKSAEQWKKRKNQDMELALKSEFKKK
jgi:hypothetical protein